MKDEEFLALYLKQNLSRVREELGKKLQYISYAEFKTKNKETEEWETTNGFKLTVLNDEGSRDKIEIGLKKPYSEFKYEDYQGLIDLVKNREYVSTETV